MRTVHSFSPPFLTAAPDAFYHHQMAAVAHEPDIVPQQNNDPRSASPAQSNIDLLVSTPTATSAAHNSSQSVFPQVSHNGTPDPSSSNTPAPSYPARSPSPIYNQAQMSIRSLLAVVSKRPGRGGQHEIWPPEDAGKADSSVNGQVSYLTSCHSTSSH